MARLTSIDIRDLILGRPLGCAVYDGRGILLLKAGAALTPDLRQRLIVRGVTAVLMDSAEVENATAPRADHAPRAKPATEDCDDRMAERRSTNRSALQESIIRHGMKRLNDAHAAQVGRLFDGLGAEIGSALADGVGVTALMNRAAAQTIDMLTSDLDSTLAAVISADGDAQSAYAQSTDAQSTDARIARPQITNHDLNVAALAAALGIEMGLGDESVRVVYYSGLLSDVGMADVPAAVRNADRRLSPREFLEIEKHVIRSANRLSRMAGIPDLVQVVVYQSHERPDGSGYPRGREGRSIHPFARIVQLASSYLALTSKRAHRPPLMPYAAMECLLKEAAARKVDPEAFRALLRTLSLFPIGGFVALSDGSIAQVVRANRESYTEPVVLRRRDARGNVLSADDETALVDLRAADVSIIQALPTPGSDETDLSEQVLNPACFNRTMLASAGVI